MNAVIYARYSSHNQTEQSIEGQLRDCYSYAKREGLTVIGEYIDRALSGKTDDRPDFQRMIADASKKQFQRIIVWKLDRFTRNRYDSAMYKHKLKAYGVKVVSAIENIGDNPESILLEALLEASAEYYSEDLKVKIKRGMRESALKGTFVGGPLPFGYAVKEKRLTIDPVNAEYVQKIFAMYAGGEGSQAIINWLNAQGLRSGRGLPIGHSWLKAVLKNRKYIGEYTHDGIPVEGGCPAIVEPVLFDTVQRKIASMRRSGGGRASAKMEYLLQGKLFCALCGSPVTGECGRSKNGSVYYYYACSKKKKLHECEKLNERKDFLEWYVVEQTMEYVLTPDRLEYIADAILAEYDKEFDMATVRDLERKIALAEGEIQKLMDRILATTNEKMADRYQARCEELDTKKTDMEIDLAKLRVAASIRYTREEIMAWLRQFCKGDLFDEPFRRRIIDVFINSIYLYDDKIVIYYNIREGKQISYIDMIENVSELEGLADVEEDEKKPSGRTKECSTAGRFGGAKGIRTPGLDNANVARYQLCYSPIR